MGNNEPMHAGTQNMMTTNEMVPKFLSERFLLGEESDDSHTMPVEVAGFEIARMFVGAVPNVVRKRRTRGAMRFYCTSEEARSAFRKVRKRSRDDQKTNSDEFVYLCLEDGLGLWVSLKVDGQPHKAIHDALNKPISDEFALLLYEFILFIGDENCISDKTLAFKTDFETDAIGEFTLSKYVGLLAGKPRAVQAPDYSFACWN
jgi:hypothetical protein